MDLPPRKCFSCGELMVKMEHSVTVECRACQVSENGKGEGSYPPPAGYDWDGVLVKFVDHGALDYPTPDSGGLPRGKVKHGQVAEKASR